MALFGTPAEVLDESVLGEAFDCVVRIIRTDDGELVIVPWRSGSCRDGPAQAGEVEDKEAQ